MAEMTMLSSTVVASALRRWLPSRRVGGVASWAGAMQRQRALLCHSSSVAALPSGAPVSRQPRSPQEAGKHAAGATHHTSSVPASVVALMLHGGWGSWRRSNMLCAYAIGTTARALHTGQACSGKYGPSAKVERQRVAEDRRKGADGPVTYSKRAPPPSRDWQASEHNAAALRREDESHDRDDSRPRHHHAATRHEHHAHQEGGAEGAHGESSSHGGGTSGDSQGRTPFWRAFLWGVLKLGIVAYLGALVGFNMAVEDEANSPLTKEVMEHSDVEDLALKTEAMERAVEKFVNAPLVESYLGRPRHMSPFPPHSLPGTFMPERERNPEPDYAYVAPARKPNANLRHWYPSVLLYFTHATLLLHFHFIRRDDGERGYFLQGIRVFKLDGDLKYEEGGPPPLGLETVTTLNVPAAAFGDEEEEAGKKKK